MLSDAQWGVLEPLVEACRPHSKVPPSNLRRTISAILWRRRERGQVALAPGRPRAVVDGSADIHRWARLGVWERLLALVQERGVALGIAFLDGTSVRAHQKAGGAARKGALKRNGTCVKRFAGLVAALEARLA